MAGSLLSLLLRKGLLKKDLYFSFYPDSRISQQSTLIELQQSAAVHDALLKKYLSSYNNIIQNIYK
jgi:hypothetical protein